MTVECGVDCSLRKREREEFRRKADQYRRIHFRPASIRAILRKTPEDRTPYEIDALMPVVRRLTVAEAIVSMLFVVFLTIVSFLFYFILFLTLVSAAFLFDMSSFVGGEFFVFSIDRQSISEKRDLSRDVLSDDARRPSVV